ncbi:restriction endonuclease [Streptomyces polyrhachis]|uniref:Restriction endonuclease n=1 Tax=Streptomyces polyrhachis TaxID=1282885 RepID=A0ABW2GCR5_9ACTN
MIHEAVLLESRSLRTSVCERTDVLDRVRVLSLLPDGMHVTTAMVAEYFGVGIKAVRSLVLDHRDELEASGYRVLTGAELSSFKELSYIQSQSASLAVFSRRAVLNVAMLLRDSEVARQVRTYLLDVETAVRSRPVDNSGAGPVDNYAEELNDWFDRRLADTLGKTLTPMVNAIIKTLGEHHTEIGELHREFADMKARLDGIRLGPSPGRPLPGVMAAMDAMGWREFERHVAELLRRDGCTGVKVTGGAHDRGIDIAGRTADGRSLVVQCKNFAPFRPVYSGEVRKFIGDAKVLRRADVALFVSTTTFTRDALDAACSGGVTAVHRHLLESWSGGLVLQVLR